jgi:UbiD family decarboxylase
MEDLREFIDKCKEIGEFKLIEGADWNIEIGAIAQWQADDPNSPLLLFDKIKGYKSGYRICCNMFRTVRREALALRLPLDAKKGMDLVRSWREKIKQGMSLIPPKVVKTGPIKENIYTGEGVDLYKFPTPKWHEHDGGRYIGTGHIVITRDPEDGWINLGTYRVQIHDKNTLTIYITPGHHADIIRRKYWANGVGCPAVVAIGGDPAIWAFSSIHIPWGAPEFDYAGWLRGKPVEVIEGITTDLPIPASAEIAIEGEIVQPEVDSRMEGPFGEWTGYYGSGSRHEPAFKVKSILHRDNPILQSSPPTLPSQPHYLGIVTRRSAELWNDLEKVLPGIQGVYQLEEPLAGKIAVISLKQMYSGHAKQVAMAAAANQAFAYMCKWIMVVDEDIDPSNIKEVLWALCTRCEPAEDIDFVSQCWGTWLDSRLPPEKRQRKQLDHSTALINACKPYHWKDEFPRDIKLSPEKLNELKNKWGKLLGGG